MSFSDHKITQFTHRISELADQPNLPADELKARFDSSPEELRESVNGICDDAARLEARVEGIVVETFGDTIDKSMLSTELAAELDAKAEEAEVLKRSDLYFGYYTGDGVYPREINMGFAPRMVFVMRADGYINAMGRAYIFLATPNNATGNTAYCKLTDVGFQLTKEQPNTYLNENYVQFVFIAVK